MSQAPLLDQQCKKSFLSLPCIIQQSDFGSNEEYMVNIRHLMFLL